MSTAPVPVSSKQRLARGEKLIGCLLRMPAEETVEMLGVAGLDFVLIDCEHGPADVGELRRHIALAQLHGLDVLVRPGEKEPALILRALDQGASGIVAPHIDTAAEAVALVRSVHYPPMGGRGFATYSRTGGFGTAAAEDHRVRALENTLVVAMIESPVGMRSAAEILAVPGIDGYLIGRADLAASSGSDDPPPAEAINRLNRETAGGTTLRADLATSVDGARASLDAGANLIVYNLAHLMMTLFAGLHPDQQASQETIA